MNEKTSERKPPNIWLRWLWVIIGIFVTITLLIVVLTARYRAANQRNQAEIQKRLEAIHAAGRPTTAQDLAKLYPDPPPEQDAALLLRPALALLSIPDESTNLLFFDLTLPRSAPLDKSVIAEGQSWLDQNQAAFDLIPWSKLEHAWIGSGFTNGLGNVTQAPLSKINRLVKFLCLRTVLEAEQQRPHEAMLSLQRAVMIANTLKNDFPIHFFLKAGSHSSISLALERVINRANPSDADLASFPNCLTVTNTGATKETALINELPMTLFLADQLKSNISKLKTGTRSPIRKLLIAFQGELLYQDEDLLHFLDWNEHCLATLNLPISNAISTLRATEAQQDKTLIHSHVSFLNAFRKNRVSLLTIAESRISHFLLNELKAVARVRLSLAALAIERWRLAHNGQIPGSMTELVPNFLPATPADPFDDQPLRYTKLAKGYVIYSIGEDLTDDGGKEQVPDANDSEHYDITFTVDR